MNFLSKVLPSETRAAELTCAVVSLVSLIMTLFGYIDCQQNLQNVYFCIFLCVIPILHLVGIIVDRYEKLRIYGSLCTGALMIYLGFLSSECVSLTGYLSTVVLGVSNMYAFIILNHRDRSVTPAENSGE